MDHSGTKISQTLKLIRPTTLPRNSNRRDRGEHELEVDQRRLGEVELGHQPRATHQRDVGLPLLADGAQDSARMADERADPRRAEAHLEGPQDPDDQDQAEPAERHDHGVDGPLALYQSAVQDGQAGQAHQADEGSGRQLPGGISGIQPTRIGTHCSPPLWAHPATGVGQGRFMCPMGGFRTRFSSVTPPTTCLSTGHVGLHPCFGSTETASGMTRKAPQAGIRGRCPRVAPAARTSSFHRKVTFR